MGAEKYTEIGEWLQYKKGLIARDYDDVNLITGRVGKGKSTWARKVARALDPTFTVERIHFLWEDYKEQYGTLEPGQAILLDEARIHKRESMTKKRMEILDHFKENRGLGLHHFICFDRASSVDKDLITDRISDWSHIRQKGRVEIRQPHTDLVFDKHGDFHEHTTYPLVARFAFTSKLPPDLDEPYDRKKDDRMRHRFRPAPVDASAPLQAAPAAPKPLINPAMLNLVQAELRRAP